MLLESKDTREEHVEYYTYLYRTLLARRMIYHAEKGIRNDDPRSLSEDCQQFGKELSGGQHPELSFFSQEEEMLTTEE
jgi:hypothetical protein